ncbi:MAG: hypothetical protein CHACPFDD_02906 [Phycisphaerae bacterium]|nr:hypothetical protein [Phycisphaerae bacterium]
MIRTTLAQPRPTLVAFAIALLTGAGIMAGCPTESTQTDDNQNSGQSTSNANDNGQDDAQNDNDAAQNDTDDAQDDTSSALTVRMRAEFDGSSLTGKREPRQDACPQSGEQQDGPHLAAGLDCDGNGGAVQYITPSTFKVALKRLTFIAADNTAIDVVPDTGLLANAQVVDLTGEVTLAELGLAPGSYPTYEAEIYYFELTMPLYDANTDVTIRVYMSDDDFASEGNLGHHQGDITIVGSNGTELGFVVDGQRWEEAALQATRGTINGAAGSDTESGHLRGLFGDAAFWNQSELAQGATRDVFIWQRPLELELAADALNVTFSFDVRDTWFFEDFDSNQLFNPCDDLDGCGGAWAPLFAEPEVVIQ